MLRISFGSSVGSLMATLFFASPLLMGASTCNLRGMENLPKASKKRTYAQNAKYFYDTAQTELKNGNFEQSRKIFRRLKTAYPFSRYATLSEIGIADSFFQAGKFVQAVDLYRIFAKLHPSHEQHPYAQYQIAQCYFKQRPWEWFLIPPNHEKDSTTTRQAIRTYKEFLQQYPHHKLAIKAKKELRTCVQQLAKHEIYVAKFYATRGKYQAVVWRMEHLLKTYPLANFNAEARLRMAKAYIKLKQPREAHGVLKTLLKKEPKSKEATEAKKTLAEVETAIALLDKGKKSRVLTASASETKKEEPKTTRLPAPNATVTPTKTSAPM
ncbi:MAG: outer membrane protein assembly factor BamD [Myxococcales bacterium]|nr:outer membrane protein assembly factor BamD [Myxococcales bacterium]